jgi:predicted MFS family arabinose efflux permease
MTMRPAMTQGYPAQRGGHFTAMRPRSVVLAIAAGLAMADASVVTLALPEMLRALHTTVEGVAAVIGVYTAVLALGHIPLGRAVSALGTRTVGAAGFALFTVASIACAGANDLTGLLIARGAQALGGSAGLVAAFAVIAHGDERQARRLWIGTSVLATAIGPALGGVLTQAFDWRAIFVTQAPIAAAAAVACLAGPRVAAPVLAPERPATRFAWRPALALALVSAALTAVLFLLVLVLVAGFGVSPLRGAATVTVLPVAALIATRIGGDPRVRAAVGCALVAAGVLALGWLPDARLAWTLVPQAVAGLGMGLALKALGGELLPERTVHDAARLLTLRHAGIAVILAVLAPIVAHQLDAATAHARAQGVALVLDAPLPPKQKIGLAPALLKGVAAQTPRTGLQAAIDRQRPKFQGSDRQAFDVMAGRADDTLVGAIGKAFRVAFLVTGALALVAALLLVPWGARASAGALVAAAVVVVALPAGYFALHREIAPAPVAIQDPCHAHRQLPSTGGISGLLQVQALKLLDVAACRLGSSREELVLALADKNDARRFKEKYGVDPRSVAGVLGRLIGG